MKSEQKIVIKKSKYKLERWDKNMTTFKTAEQNKFYEKANELAEQGKWRRAYGQVKKLTDSFFTDEKVATSHVVFLIRIAFMLAYVKNVSALTILETVKKSMQNNKKMTIEISLSDLLKYHKVFIIVFKEIGTISQLYFSGAEYLVDNAIEKLKTNTLKGNKND